jgi:hypothetical protein
MDNFKRYLDTYSGQRLLDEYSLSDEGVWVIFGEDLNCDLDGNGDHFEPLLGYYKGKLSNIIAIAVEMPFFWGVWGDGGRIAKAPDVIVKDVPDVGQVNSRLKELLEQRRKLDKEIDDVKAFLK